MQGDYSERVDLLEEYLSSGLEMTSRNLVKYRKTQHVYQLVALIGTAIITVVLGIKQIPMGKEIALVVGAFLSITKGIELQVNFNDRIVEFKKHNDELARIFEELQYFKVDETKSNSTNDIDVIKNLFERYHASNNNFNNSWVGQFNETKEKS